MTVLVCPLSTQDRPGALAPQLCHQSGVRTAGLPPGLCFEERSGLSGQRRAFNKPPLSAHPGWFVPRHTGAASACVEPSPAPGWGSWRVRDLGPLSLCLPNSLFGLGSLRVLSCLPSPLPLALRASLPWPLLSSHLYFLSTSIFRSVSVGFFCVCLSLLL